MFVREREREKYACFADLILFRSSLISLSLSLSPSLSLPPLSLSYPPTLL